MKRDEISLTAQLTAYARGHHARFANPRVFNDLLAHQLLTEDQRKQIEFNLPQLLPLMDPDLAGTVSDPAEALDLVIGLMMSDTLSRSRFAEDELSSALENGVTQYILLGAGLDTFAFRHRKLLDALSVFEVDHPATQASKRNRLAELGWDIAEQLHFVPCDFTEDSLLEVLPRAGYNPRELGFFSWLGVTLYLPREAVFATLQDIANLTPSGSAVVFDYLDASALAPGRTSGRLLLMQKVVQQVGEPLHAGLYPATLEEDLAALGLHLEEDLTPEEIRRRYFAGRDDNYRPSEHFHYALVTVE